jgi:A/G-specific adenine glycosylase
LQQRCAALAEDRVAELPVRAPKKTVPTRQVNMLVIVDQSDNVLLEKRPDSGIWGGLFSLPEVAYQPDKSARQVQNTLRRVAGEFGEPDILSELAPISHGFTHFKLEISPFQCRIKKSALAVSEATHVWYPLKKYQAAPLPAPIKKLLGRVLEEFNSI